MSNEFEDAITKYRAELRAGSELADGDLDEIEDHLRSLTDELRGRGMPAADAVIEAARRLGEPHAIAREHSRVRSAFGARLSAARTWSVVALMLPVMAYSVWARYPTLGLLNRFNLEVALELVLLVALVRRMGWARPILLAASVFSLALTGWLGMLVETNPLWLVWNIGVFAFLVPWRRNKLTPSGLALAGHVWGYCAASWALSFQITTSDGTQSAMVPLSIIACVAAAVATSGAVLRARWSTMAGLVSTGALAVVTYQLLGIDFRFTHATAYEIMIIGSVGSGAVATMIGSVLAWRTARSTLGSLRAIRG